MLEAVAELGTTNLLVVPGAVSTPGSRATIRCPWPNATSYAREAVGRMKRRAPKSWASIWNIENIFFNGYLLSPQDMITFVDGFKSKHAIASILTRATSCFSSSRRTDPGPGFAASATSTSRSSTRTVRTIRWQASARCWTAPPTGRPCWKYPDTAGYKGYLTFESFPPPLPTLSRVLVYQTSDALVACWGEREGGGSF